MHCSVAIVDGDVMVSKTIQRFQHTMQTRQFLFQQLVNRDFQHRYKGTMLGMAWSVLSPLCNLAVMLLVFGQLFGRNVDHYIIYLFSGNIIMSYYRESTNNGMASLLANARIILKINIPKYLFLLSSNISALINFGLTIGIYFFFCVVDGITFTPKMFMLPYSVVCLVVMNIGVGMILSALYVLFRDLKYLYGIFLTLLNYLSAIFYTVDRFPVAFQRLLLLNPVYVNILYWRTIVIDQTIPSLSYHLLMAFYSLLFLAIGSYCYKRLNHRFVYYF